jgi:hypothetical protein
MSFKILVPIGIEAHKKFLKIFFIEGFLRAYNQNKVFQPTLRFILKVEFWNSLLIEKIGD